MKVVGVDEAGRGALAGPVVAAAIIFKPGQDTSQYTDSKQIAPKSREILFEQIICEAEAYGIGVISAQIVDRVNVLQATFLAMKKAIFRLGSGIRLVLVDGNREIPNLDFNQKTMIKGDARVPLIGAASILAKVARDRIMRGYAKVYPNYLFEVHKGYGTRKHMSAIDAFGFSPIHRRTFNTSRQLRLF